MYKFENFEEIIEGIGFRAKECGIKITSVFVDEETVFVEFDKFIATNLEIIDFYKHVRSRVITAQNVFKPQTITNHIIKDSSLSVNKSKCEIIINCNREFDSNGKY